MEPTAQAAAPAQPVPGQSTATQAADATARGDINQGFGFNPMTGKPYTSAADAAAGEKQAAAPAADGKLTPQQLAAKKAELKGKRAAGKTAGTTASGFNKYTKDASSQRIVGANPDGSPKIQQIKASKINLGNNLSEALAQKVELQKRKMFESGLANGQSSIFKK